MQPAVQYTHSIHLLRGSSGYFAAVLCSFAASVLAVFYGLHDLDIPAETKTIASLATLFLISSTFTVAKTVRDTQLSELLVDTVPGTELLRGTYAWRGQCWVSFSIALVYSFYVVTTLGVAWDVKGFVLMGLLFTLSASLNLSKLVRDRQDAEYFSAKGQRYLSQVRFLAAGTVAHSLVTWTMFVVNIASFFYGLHAYDIVIERKGFLGMGVTFMVYAAFMLAKAVRDNASGTPALMPSALHWLMYITAFVVSTGLTLGGILVLMPFEPAQKAFLGLSVVCILSVTFNLAKLVRDKQDAVKSHAD